MKYYGTDPIPMCCHNCGHKCIGYKSRDQTVHFSCDRCGMVWVSRKKDKRTIDTRSTAPLGQEVMF